MFMQSRGDLLRSLFINIKELSFLTPFLILFFLFLFPLVSKSVAEYTFNELPMYGNIKKTPEIKKTDAGFVRASIEKYGNKEKASEVYVKHGWYYFNKGELSVSIRRFNQAWLLNSKNFDAFWGFGAVLLKRKEFDKSLEMFNMGLELAPDNVKLLIDTAQAYTGKAVDDSKSNNNEKQKYLAQAIKFYEHASHLAPNSAILYSQWAITLFYQGKYREAWGKIYQSRGSDKNDFIPTGFIEELESHMPDPFKK